MLPTSEAPNMKAIIIDDEKRARINLALLLEEYCPNVEIVAECENLPSGVKAIRKHRPNVVFLDIEMPGHSGLELLDFFDDDDVNFAIIFTTAYNEYAVRAFKFSAIDYLLKPIVPEELQDALKRAEKQQELSGNYKILKENLASGKLDKIAVPSGSSLIFIDADKILYIKGEGAYSEITMIDGSKHIVSRNLKSFEEILCLSADFFRAHKSYIVNMAYVNAYKKADGGSLLLTQNISIPLSPDRVQSIFEKIKMIKR